MALQHKIPIPKDHSVDIKIVDGILIITCEKKETWEDKIKKLYEYFK